MLHELVYFFAVCAALLVYAWCMSLCACGKKFLWLYDMWCVFCKLFVCVWFALLCVWNVCCDAFGMVCWCLVCFCVLICFCILWMCVPVVCVVCLAVDCAFVVDAWCMLGVCMCLFWCGGRLCLWHVL